MRLLDVHQLELKEFFDEKKRPEYAILSHTWGEGEVSLQDLSTPAATAMAGFSKIKRCCELAIQDDFEYIWVDTCCIDKTSSSELSEAINSMYQWYKSATVCYAYLSDVVPGEDPTDPHSSFSRSRWFTRGWTLQELLAPKIVTFHDSDWNEIGTKFNLKGEISRITGISREVLSNEPIGAFSIAQRMSWASKRETTRVEDIAYSLMGIFEINMPTLYGEGQRAFIRLQYEILRTSDDHSLFAWIHPRKRVEGVYIEPKDDVASRRSFPPAESGLLASSPLQFQHSQGIQRLEVPSSRYPYSMTNKGLHIWLPMAPIREDRSSKDPPIYQAILDCTAAGGTGPLKIYLRQNPSGQYSRVFTTALHLVHNVKHDLAPVELYVKEAYPESPIAPFKGSRSPDLPKAKFTIHLAEHPSVEQGYTLVECGPKNSWNENTATFDTASKGVFLYFIVRTNDRERNEAMVVLGVESTFFESETPLCCAIYSGAETIRKTKTAFKRSQIMVNALTIKDIDRITRRLPSGHIISIALRLRPTPNISTFNYRIAITFTPPNFPSPRLDNPVLVSPHTMHIISRLPQLTIYLAYRYRPRPRARFATPPFYPKSNWLINQPYDDALTLTWMPTGQDSSAFLGFSTKSRMLKFPLLVFHVVDFDIAVEFVEVPLNLQHSDWDTVLPSYLGVLNTTRNLYRSSDFPKDVEVNGDTMQIKLRRKTFLEETGHQMLVTFDANTASERISQVQEMDEEEEQEKQQQEQQEEEEEEGVKMNVMLGIFKRSSVRA